jgi:endoglucanase
VDPESRAGRQAAAWAARGKDDRAALLERIARQPVATWLTGGDPEARVRAVTTAAARADRIPVLVAYDIPDRDCGLYSSGGASDAAAYHDWIARFAAGIADRRALVVLEPDAIAQLVAGCPAAELDGDRLAQLADAITQLKAHSGTEVYLDAGNAGWIANTGLLAEVLYQAGVTEADGFALNVSNFQTTAASKAYGDRISALLGGTHYVIDTSRNGAGPWNGPRTADGGVSGSSGSSGGSGSGGSGPSSGTSDDESWCNPPDRALGAPPTIDTGDPLVDAYLWVKRPGESDGSCRGAPPAGSWWSAYALPGPRRDRLAVRPGRPARDRLALADAGPLRVPDSVPVPVLFAGPGDAGGRGGAVGPRPGLVRHGPRRGHRTCSHTAFDGVPRRSVTKSMYQPLGTSEGSSGTVKRIEPLPRRT